MKADSGAGGAVPVECQASVYTHTSTFTSTFDGWGVPENNPTPTLVPIPSEDGGPPSGTVQSLDTQVGLSTPGSANSRARSPAQASNCCSRRTTPRVNLSGRWSPRKSTWNPVIGDPVTSVVQAFVTLKRVRLHLCDGPAVNLEPGAG